MRSRGAAGVMLLLGVGVWPVASGQKAARPAQGGCRSAVIEGEAKAGQGLRKSFASGLDLVLEPVAAGWVVRVVPTLGERPRVDYAEIATPPYRSVSPLLLSTDFSFRAQDAIGWNPRRFRYAADARAYGRLEPVYRRIVGSAHASARDEAALGQIVSEQPEGELRILDASLVPGTADATRAATLVATHFADTAHRMEQPAAGSSGALGRIGWVRVRVRLVLPRGMQAARGVEVVNSVCGGD